MSAAASPVQVVAAGSQAAVLRADPAWSRLESFARSRGFWHWTYSADAVCAPVGSPSPSVTVTTYPEGHTREFFARRLDRTNPARPFVRAHREPSTYAAVRESALPPSRAVAVQLALNRHYDVTRGVIVPLHDVLGTWAVLGLAYRGSEADLDQAFASLAPEIERFARDLHRAVQRRHAPTFIGRSLPRLSPRQGEVLRLFAEGLGNAEVADCLSLSVHTVDKHVARIKAAFGARTLAQATALALQWKLLPRSR